MNAAATTIPKTSDGAVGRLNSECARIARRPTPGSEVRRAEMRPGILQPGNRNRFCDTRTNSNRSFADSHPDQFSVVGVAAAEHSVTLNYRHRLAQFGRRDGGLLPAQA
jgi:hypothetical protein